MVIETVLVGAGGAFAWFSSQYAWWRPATSWRHPRVLMYHMVSPHRPGARFNKLRVPPDTFRQQLEWLRNQRFTFVFASQLFSDDVLPDKTVCLTFDDGFEDNLLAADPLMAEFGAVGTLYLVTDRTQGWSSKKKAHHADDELQNEPKLADEQIHNMLASGRWELGGHTRTHANLAKLNAADARGEIAASRSDIKATFGTIPQTFAYPFGIFTEEHERMLAEEGFLGAVTTEPGIRARPFPQPLRVPRVKVSGTEGLWSFILRMRGGQRGLWK